MLLPLLALLCTSIVHSKRFDGYPFQNVSLSFEDRVKDLVNRLDLSELVAQMAHGGANNNGPAPAISRLGINPYQWGTECLSGDVNAGPATSFPMAIGMAASFDYDLVFAVANATSCEVRAKNIDTSSRSDYDFHTGLSCWSPVINIMRDPRWGRNQETYGEDPWLSGYLSQAYVTGLQGNDSRYVRANAGCKHFDVHGGPENIPTSRFSFNAVVSERDWRMTFLPQFKMCVDAGSWSIMCSYNRINGVPSCANNKLLTDILYKEWNFKGYVVSDQEALENIAFAHHYTSDLLNASAVAANAGTCLDDSNNGNENDKSNNAFLNLEDAVNKGMVDISVLKAAVSRLFIVRMKLGEFDPPDMNPYTKLSLDIIQSDEHRNLSLKAALKSAVLLKNDIQFGLPITTTKSICVLGPFINNTDILFGDYSPDPMNKYIVTPLAGIMKYFNGVKITSAAVCEDGPKCQQYNQSAIKSTCAGADTIIVTAGLSKYLESEGNDRSDIHLPGSQSDMLLEVYNVPGVVKAVLVLFNAGPVDIETHVNNSRFGSILELFYPAQSAGDALGMILTGLYSPAGRLPYTWFASPLSNFPEMTDYTMKGRTYRYSGIKSLFSFGYGLSFTSFSYSNLQLSAQQIKPGDNISISVTVQNTGNVDSDEVVQVYISWDQSVAEAPLKQLVGVKRIFIADNQEQMLTFSITATQMQVWTTQWIVAECTMTVFVGGQQPGGQAQTRANSNILQANFIIKS